MRSINFSISSIEFWDRRWTKNKSLHRGKLKPAVQYKNGVGLYYFEGFFCELLKDHLYCVSSNFVVWENGTREHRMMPRIDFCANLHRTTGPAVEYANGDVEYWIHGKRHNENGPAVIYGDKKYWYINGEFVKCT
ncbi:MAG: hypothetical protein EKK64_04865 [Neisseriaceae bacterium]|nr:MAG: hypothetical protein EKK64_04865 [Neisseriaceae bacterium]